jgi:hypothetical protein
LTFQYPCSPLSKGGEGTGVGGFNLLAVFIKSGRAIGITERGACQGYCKCPCTVFSTQATWRGQSQGLSQATWSGQPQGLPYGGAATPTL